MAEFQVLKMVHSRLAPSVPTASYTHFSASGLSTDNPMKVFSYAHEAQSGASETPIQRISDKKRTGSTSNTQGVR
jgi:hypothetical protein